MPYYHGPQVIAARNNDNCPDANHCQAIVSTVMVNNFHSLCHLSNIPVRFGDLGQVTPSTSCSLNNPHKSQKWIYKIKLLQIVKVIVSNCWFMLSQIRLFDLVVIVNIFDTIFSLFVAINVIFRSTIIIIFKITILQ